MLIKRTDLANVEEFFTVFYHQKDFFLCEKSFRTVRRSCADGISMLAPSEMNEFDYFEKIFEVIKEVISIYKDDERKSRFIRECIIKRMPWQIACKLLSIERRTYFTWKEEILIDTVCIAIGRGLLRFVYKLGAPAETDKLDRQRL